MKVVHVQLTDKWAKIVVFEVFGQNILRECIWIFNYEAIPF